MKKLNSNEKTYEWGDKLIQISVCMIVKNEETVLDRCLKSLVPIADEIIVVDTGSTDRTKEIASGYTDKIYDFSWTGNFSDARNYAFSKATKDYIYSADADEEIDPENIRQFLLLKEAILPEIEIVQMWYENCGDLHTTENYHKELRPKLYKRLRTFVWEDPVHEMVRMTPLVYDSDITILHKPVGEHGNRDIQIFEKMVSNGAPLSDRLKNLYARELVMAGNAIQQKNAEPYFRQQQANLDESIARMKEAGVIQARVSRNEGNDSEFMKQALKDMLTDPCSEMCVEIGRYFEGRGDYEEAILWYYNAAFETESILDLKAQTEIPLERLSICYDMLAETMPNECQSDISKCREMSFIYGKMVKNSR